MKRIITFAIMALLMGGFAANANAQGKDDATKESNTAKTTLTTSTVKTTSNTETVAVKEDWNKVIANYEETVNKCVALNDTEKGTKAFTDALDKALSLKTKIEKVKDQLNRTQIHRFNEATAKLNKLMAKN